MKRQLTSSEIKDIISIVELPFNIPSKTKKCVIKKLQVDLFDQLKNAEIYPDMIPSLKNEVKRQFERTLAQAGESVGVVAAQSIGERQTQSTLDTFHSAGLTVETVVTGVPRFTELLNATHDPKSVMRTIYLNDTVESIGEMREIVKDKVVYLELADIIKSYVYQEEISEESWYSDFELIYGNDFRSLGKVIKISLDFDKIYEYKLCLKKVSKIIEEAFDVKCVFSPSWLNQIDVFVNEETAESIDDFLPSLKKIKIAGIDDILSVNYRKQGDEWYMIVHGSGSFNTLINLDFINKNRILSNNMWDIYEMFGIESARQFLIDEFMNVVSSDGTYINIRHVMIMVDIMTYTGSITSISRYGINRKEVGVLSKASFEESLDNFLKAGMFTDLETTNAVSSAIMCGKTPRLGTGCCSVMMDLQALQENTLY